jgi:hypothetical protein
VTDEPLTATPDDTIPRDPSPTSRTRTPAKEPGPRAESTTSDHPPFGIVGFLHFRNLFG